MACPLIFDGNDKIDSLFTSQIINAFFFEIFILMAAINSNNKHELLVLFPPAVLMHDNVRWKTSRRLRKRDFISYLHYIRIYFYFT